MAGHGPGQRGLSLGNTEWTGFMGMGRMVMVQGAPAAVGAKRTHGLEPAVLGQAGHAAHPRLGMERLMQRGG